MRLLSLFLAIFVVNTSFSQTYKTEPTSVKFKKIKREYSVLTKNKKVRHGAFKEYYKKHLAIDGVYHLGKEDGAWVYKDPESFYLQKGTYDKGNKIGEWSLYFQGELVKKEYYSKSGRLNRMYEYNLKGKKFKTYFYNVNEGVGKSRETLDNGFVEKVSVLTSGVPHGSVAIYYPNGQLLQERNYVKGKLYAVSDVYKEDGKVLRKSRFKNGNGRLVTYHLDKLKEGKSVGKHVVKFKDSIPLGMFNEYDNSGKLIASGVLGGAFKNGIWKEWSNAKGKMVSKDYNSPKYKKSRIYNFPVFENYNPKEVSFSSIVKNHVSTKVDKKKGLSYTEEKLNAAVNSLVAKNINKQKLATFFGKEKQVYRVYVVAKLSPYGELVDVKVKRELGKKKLDNVAARTYVASALKKLPTTFPMHQRHMFRDVTITLPLDINLKE